MGYFSELDLTNRENNIDRSYRGFEEGLLWRYEDLKERYSLLSREGAPINGDDYFSKNDYKYAPIKCFNTLSDVCRAMEIAKEDLKEICKITIDEGINPENELDEDEDESTNQISLFEIVLLPTWFHTAAAA